MRLSMLLMVAFAIFLQTGSSNAHEFSELNELTKTPITYDHYLLPTSVCPREYNLRIVTHLENSENLTFDGEVAILLEILQDTRNITLHVHNLTIDTAGITLKNIQSNGPDNCVQKTEVNGQHDYFIMELCAPVNKGETYLLTMPFAGALNQKLSGYYKSSYHDKASNETRWLSITQFEPAHARAAFPCFDEPEYKAKFTVILGHHKKYTALSNMPLKETKPMSDHTDWLWSEFEESVPMSTYLVAYSINDFEYANVETNLKNNVQFRTWARRDAINQCDYAGIVGPKVLEYYEDVFDIKFPLQKIDQIAIPDFSAGAMENWGLVTYRETALLYAENVSSVVNKQRVASVIAHELAHQWFGNLVTMKWWTDLWLNEGFATYIAALGVEHISPEWSSLQEESVDNTLTIFKLDALRSSHPISQPIHHVNEIYEIFDSISYKKGASVLRMMHKFLGNEAFRSGVTHYLKKHSYSNAEQDNLWSALTESAHEFRSIPDSFDIKRIMDSWTLQTGYPVITVTRDYKAKTATLTQVRYLLDTRASRTEGNNCWWVPLSYTTQRESNFSHTAPRDWLECDKNSKGGPIVKVLENMPESNEWIIFNLQMTGLYKVKYDEDNWNLLIDALLSKDYQKIHIMNRAQLLDDALDLAWSGDMDYDIAMRLMEYLMQETEYIPWKTALDNLSAVNRILRPSPEYEFFKKYMQKILTPIYRHVHGLNVTKTAMEDHTATLHKILITGWSCRFEVDDCVPRARAYFNEWRSVANPDELNPIPTDLRTVIYCSAMRHGNDRDWHFLWTRYQNSNVAAEKRTILSALGCTREIWLLQRFLEWSFDDTSGIRKQDSYLSFGAVARGEVGFHLARDYFINNIEFLHDFYEPESTSLSRLFSPLTSQVTSKREYETLNEFVKQNKHFLRKAEQGVRRALETAQINVQWKESNYEAISRRLRSRLIEL